MDSPKAPYSPPAAPPMAPNPSVAPIQPVQPPNAKKPLHNKRHLWLMGVSSAVAVILTGLMSFMWFRSNMGDKVVEDENIAIETITPSPTATDRVDNENVFVFTGLGISLELPPSWIPTSTEYKRFTVGPENLILRLNLPLPLTSEEELEFENNVIHVRHDSLSPAKEYELTLYRELVLKDGSKLIFHASNNELEDIFNQILESFEFLRDE